MGEEEKEMEMEMEMVPFLSVLKGEEVVDTISLQGRDTLVMGRHHSCDLVVSHASSSRRHVEIQIIHSTRDIVLTDLGSVHGTWVNGTRLSVMTPVVINASFTFQLAASTRIYRIDWQPIPADQKSELENSSSESIYSSTESSTQETTSQTQCKPRPGLRQMNENQENNSKPPSNGLQPRGEKGLVVQQDTENLSPAILNSPGKFGQLQRAASSPKLPLRRLAFSSLQPSRANTRSPRSTSGKKGLVDRAAPTKPPPAETSSPSRQNNKPLEITTPSKLWLRRCSSAPPSALTTGAENKIAPSAPPLSALMEAQETFRESPGYEDAFSVKEKTKSAALMNIDEVDDEYPPDKENVDPVRLPYKPAHSSSGLSMRHGGPTSKDSSLIETIERQPFRPLFTPLPCSSSGYKPVFQNTADSYASSEEDYSKALVIPTSQQKLCPTAQNLDLLLRRLKLADANEGRKQWHAVIDTNCLLHYDSLKALKQLEGIKEVCVIIPKIVVRELDFLKHREGLRSPAREALRWIESCMLKMPNWIHVQKSSETLPVGDTPPTSPSVRAFPHHGDLMSPTNDDHILECALLFDMTVHNGKVALLTRDTALKIKAMAEGLVSEGAVEFCESLLSPYSNRFLWAGSTAHGKTWVDSPLHSPVYAGEIRTNSHAQLHRPTVDLRNHISSQPRGLQVVVSR